MYDGRPHPLLAQIPLTVSPFISLPTATTLPYTYKTLPSTLPPSSTADSNGVEREKYVVSASGHAAHPDDIIQSCQALQAHLQKLQDDAKKALKEWEDDMEKQVLAEKRRVAPGWLDREEKILEPERKRASLVPSSQADHNQNIMDSQGDGLSNEAEAYNQSNAAGDELDRAFGGITLQ